MKKYIWDLNELRNLKQKYIDDSCGLITEKENERIQTNILTISSMIQQHKFRHPFFTTINNLFSKIDPNYNIDSFRKDKNDFSTEFQIDVAFSNNKLLKSYNDLLYDFKDVKKKLPLEKQILLTKENYLSIFGNEKDINFMLNPKNHKINMVKNSNNNFTYSIDDISYLMIYYSNTLKTYFALNHEFGHFYENCLGNKITYFDNSKLYSYSEISSIFLELISADKLLNENIITTEEHKDAHLDILTTNLKIYDFMQALAISSKSSINLPDKFKLLTYSDVLNQLHYHFSYIIALNLYYQYLQNPKESVANLKYILSNITENNEEEILKNAEIDLTGNCLEKHILKQKRNN